MSKYFRLYIVVFSLRLLPLLVVVVVVELRRKDEKKKIERCEHERVKELMIHIMSAN